VLREIPFLAVSFLFSVSLNTNILTHLQLEGIQSAQRNSTTKPGIDISPTSAMELFLHGTTAMNYHHGTVCLPPHYEKYRMQCIQCSPLMGTILIGPGPQPNCSQVALL